MRHAKSSDQDIITAGLALQAEGRCVSANALRDRLNGGNTKRLAKIWEGYADTSQGAASKIEAPTQALLAESAAKLDDALITIHKLQQQITAERKKADQAEIVLNAVTDQLNRSKMLVERLEERDKVSEKRIAELVGRIDEQRTELYRSARANSALELALKQLQAFD
jgi:chromosome segregation ATPase